MSQEIISTTKSFVKDTLTGVEAGHDWHHIHRVYLNAMHIAQQEPSADMFVVELASLLHDIADAKLHGGDEDIGPRTARNFLESIKVEEDTIAHVENIIRHISFRTNIDGQKWSSLELEIVQDADRLDALGAIGIARMFNYGGHKNRPLYDPEIKPNLNLTKEEYKSTQGTTFNHFYEKLLLLKDKMNTKTGKEIAQARHEYMETFIKQFLAEWSGEK